MYLNLKNEDIKVINNTLVARISGTSVDALQSLLTRDKPLQVQIDIQRDKRSLRANNKMWAMCQEIAEASSCSGAVVTKEDVYRKNIEELFAPVVKNVPIEDAAFFKGLWRSRGLGWIAKTLGVGDKRGCVQLGLWVGSSRFNTKQMSRLIDGVNEDARALGLQILSDADKDLLLKYWKPEQERG